MRRRVKSTQKHVVAFYNPQISLKERSYNNDGHVKTIAERPYVLPYGILALTFVRGGVQRLKRNISFTRVLL